MNIKGVINGIPLVGDEVDFIIETTAKTAVFDKGERYACKVVRVDGKGVYICPLGISVSTDTGTLRYVLSIACDLAVIIGVAQ